MHNVTLRLTWTKTQDYFDIEIENLDFATWFVEQCNQFGNSFECIDNVFILQDLVTKLLDNIEQVNHFLQVINFPIQIPITEHVVNRDSLNIMHKNWVRVLRHEPRIDRIMYKKNKDLFEKFHNINNFVHDIEKKLDYRCQDRTRWRVENKFKEVLPKYGTYNVSLKYVDWGKSSFHKFIDGDQTPNDDELSNWNNIGSDIGICLTPPHALDFSQDYLKYCATHQIKMATPTWPLGNIIDYNNRYTVENLLYKNFQISDNNFKFSLHR
jgi:hypothetical protein